MKSLEPSLAPRRTWRIRQVPWIAGSTVFLAWAYLNFAAGMLAPADSLFAVPQPKIGWSIGWPAQFFAVFKDGATRTNLRAFLSDLLLGVLVVGSTVMSVRLWKLGRRLRVVPSTRLLVVILLTMGGWWLFTRDVNVPLLLAWISLAIILASFSCVAYAVVMSVGSWRIPRYDLRMMFLVMTAICVASALGSALRSPYLAMLVIVLFCVSYGLWTALFRAAP